MSRWIVCAVDVDEHDEFVEWVKARVGAGNIEWDHNSAWPAFCWVYGLAEKDRLFAKLRWS